MSYWWSFRNGRNGVREVWHLRASPVGAAENFLAEHAIPVVDNSAVACRLIFVPDHPARNFERADFTGRLLSGSSRSSLNHSRHGPTA